MIQNSSDRKQFHSWKLENSKSEACHAFQNRSNKLQLCKYTRWLLSSTELLFRLIEGRLTGSIAPHWCLSHTKTTIDSDSHGQRFRMPPPFNPHFLSLSLYSPDNFDLFFNINTIETVSKTSSVWKKSQVFANWLALRNQMYIGVRCCCCWLFPCVGILVVAK